MGTQEKVLLVYLGEDVPSIFAAVGNSSPSSTDHPIFLLTCLQKHFLRKAIFPGFQKQCTYRDSSEMLETKGCSGLCKCIPGGLR